VGQIKVAGKTLSQIESDITDAYHPEYVIIRPTVFARVLEYKTAKVSITGAVQKPGIYSLRSDQMSLVALLMEADGIIDDGASIIRINHPEQDRHTRKKAGLTPYDLIRTKEVNFTSRYPGSDEVEIQLYFQQDAPASTIGILTIRQGEQILFFDQIDLANKGERLLLLDKLGRAEPHLSIVDVDQKLNELKDSIKNDFDKYNNEYKVADSNIDLSMLRTTNSALYENLSQAESQLSKSGLEEKLSPDAKRKLLEYQHRTSDRQQEEIVSDVITEQNVKSKTEKITAQEPETLVLPIKGLNIPFVDVALQGGDRVIVEKLEPSLITVMGLVNRPGNFPYAPDARFNLAQALGFAGGLNEVADPRYVTVHRLNSDGTIVSAVFPIKDGSRLTEAANTLIKPGDIVDVEHTPRTRTAVFLDRVFRITIGTYLRPEDIWE
jgi:protein involved in polysaccharide export with SLBB domain